MGNLPDGKDIKPEKVVLGCVTPEDKDGVLLCNPKVEIDGKQVPLTKDGPIAVEQVDSDKWRLADGGKDMTLERQEAFKKALKKGQLG